MYKNRLPIRGVPRLAGHQINERRGLVKSIFWIFLILNRWASPSGSGGQIALEKRSSIFHALKKGKEGLSRRSIKIDDTVLKLEISPTTPSVVGEFAVRAAAMSSVCGPKIELRSVGGSNFKFALESDFVEMHPGVATARHVAVFSADKCRPTSCR